MPDKLDEAVEQLRKDKNHLEIIRMLKNKLAEELKNFEITSDNAEHHLNLIVRETEEELDHIENEKLVNYDPEK